MDIPSIRQNIIFCVLLFSSLCFSIASVASVKAQGKPDIPLHNEIWGREDPAFISRHSSRQTESAMPESVLVDKKVHFIYLVPQDRAPRDDYRAALTDAALHLQDFYQHDIGNDNAFLLNNPVVEIYQTSHTVNWYQTHDADPGNPNIWFWNNALSDGLGFTGGTFNDPNNRWVFYIDADIACDQLVGGTSGVALLPANDFRGLTGQNNVNPCGGGSDQSGKYRWIGGLGHELGHAFNLPHPPGCGSAGGCDGGQTANNSLMYLGYTTYPNTYFLSDDRTSMLGLGFFSPADLRPPRPVDYDKDRKADISIWRPSDGIWYNSRSTDGANFTAFGLNGDKIVPGDYDGDRKTDLAVWRPSAGAWYIYKSATNTVSIQSFGLNGDIPVAADYDGDRLADIAVWRPATGAWYIVRSATSSVFSLNFGTSGDRPVPADFNGDKRTDLAVFRPGENRWYIYLPYFSYYYYAFPNNAGQITYTVSTYGLSDDKQVPADYDGDGKADLAAWRPSSGVWYYLGSSNGQSVAGAFGQNGDIPTPGDYDNDGKTDFSVWRPSTGAWYISQSSNGVPIGTYWGLSGDVPAESAYVR
jgi:hypothetical protein